MNGLDLDLQSSALLKVEVDEANQDKVRKVIAGNLHENKEEAILFMEILGLL